MRIPVSCVLGLLVGVGLGACTVDSNGLGGIADASGRAGTGTTGTGFGGVGPAGVAGTTGGAGSGGIAGTVQPGGAGGAGTGGASGAGGDSSLGGTGGITAVAGSGGTGGAAGTGGGAGTSTGGTAGGAAGSAGTAGGGGGTTGNAGTGGGMGGKGGAGGSLACNLTCLTGCCLNGQCVNGSSVQACGSGGGQCKQCGACFRCGNAKTCEPEPSSTWTVTCVSATVKSTKMNGEVWDTMTPNTPASAPDPFCRLDADTRSKSSSTIADSLSPVWDDNVTPTSGGGLTASLLLDSADRWKISVIDSDLGTGRPDDPICSFSPHPTANDLANGTLTIGGSGQCTTVVLGFACAP